jgi:mono/diheme cytochrome c family protein
VRRYAFIAAIVLGASVLAACQSQGVSSPTPQTVIGTVATTPSVKFPVVAAFHLKGNAAAGKPIFVSSCGGCHTLADAKTVGQVGPNLDTFNTPKPYYQMVTAQVTIGGSLEKGTMPSFKGTLTDQQIADVAAYVVTATGGKAP